MVELKPIDGGSSLVDSFTYRDYHISIYRTEYLRYIAKISKNGNLKKSFNSSNIAMVESQAKQWVDSQYQNGDDSGDNNDNGKNDNKSQIDYKGYTIKIFKENPKEIPMMNNGLSYTLYVAKIYKDGDKVNSVQSLKRQKSINEAKEWIDNQLENNNGDDGNDDDENNDKKISLFEKIIKWIKANKLLILIILIIIMGLVIYKWV